MQQQSRGKPVLGAVLGAVIGVIAVLILQQGAVVLPTRLVVFGILGIATSAGSLLLTVAYRRPAVVAIHSIAVLAVAFALTGIPAMTARGDLSGPCTVSAVSSLWDAGSPADTSVRDPFDIAPAGTLDWRIAFPEPYETWSGTVGVDIAGFRVPVRTQGFDNTARETFREGSEDVPSRIREIEDISGLTVTGVYHVFASAETPGGACKADMYVRIAATSLFSGPILQGLWTCAAIVALIFAAYILQVRRAPADGDDARAPADGDDA
jgi:hypothetical protein